MASTKGSFEAFTRLAPAPDVQIDKDKFSTVLRLLALRVPKLGSYLLSMSAAHESLTVQSCIASQAKCQLVMKELKGLVLDMPRHRSVMTDPQDDSMRLVLLKEEIEGKTLPTLSKEKRERAGLDELQVTEYDLHLGYDYFNAEQILRKLLPAGVEVPGSFETVGHIAHLNLRDEVADYKHMIGRVLLDKNPRLRTVINKVGSIDSEFRVPEWELLAGDTSLETEVRQHGIPFKLDFGEVYWNSRLEAEHKRVIDLIKPGEILCDAMAGIGPFAVPAARADRRVYANDLNPQCAHYLRVNAHASKVKHMVKCYNLDARAFIRALLRPGPGPDLGSDEVEQQVADGDQEGVGEAAAVAAALKEAGAATWGASGLGAADAARGDGKRKPKPAKPIKPMTKWAAKELEDDEGEPPAGAVFDHLAMNLPATAIEFLDVFKGAFDRAVWGSRKLPTIHCYTFKRAAETFDDVVKRGEGYLGARITDPHVREVRDVAPNKIMLCLTFTLTPDVAFWEGECAAANNKRARTSK